MSEIPKFRRFENVVFTNEYFMKHDYIPIGSVGVISDVFQDVPPRLSDYFVHTRNENGKRVEVLVNERCLERRKIV